MVLTPPLSRVTWRPSWRIVSSLFPPRGLFDRVASREDLDTVMAIEGLTNDRVRQAVGDIALVPEEDCVFGPGTTPIMAAFTHPARQGSRFADPSCGVYYCAESIDTAVAETRYHKERFLRATHEPRIEVDMRSYASDIDACFHDLRGLDAPDLYDPDPARYGTPQALAKSLRDRGSNGIAYDSVRDPGGACTAVFRPRLLAPVTQGPHLCYVWDGERISDVYVKAEYRKAGRRPQQGARP